MAGSRFGVDEVRIRGFRSARSVRFTPSSVCALVGGPSVGKSNVLSAIWTLLQRGSPAPESVDVTTGSAAAIHLSATLRDGGEITLEASPPARAKASGRTVAVLFLPASLRSGPLVAQPIREPAARRIAGEYLGVGTHSSSAAQALTLVSGLERLCETDERGLVLLIEEPELFLRPQAQRYLYRLLRGFAAQGNQVLYSTHEPSFLNVGRLDEVALVEHSAHAGTSVIQPQPMAAEASFRALNELDAERGELFLARAVVLVEGRTEKLTLPFVFRALGYDHDREEITIVDCGGKPNIPLFIRICQAARIPCVAIHDRDAPAGRRPTRAEAKLNAEIAALAGHGRTVVLAPDFEAVAGLRGRRHKPAHAWRHFSSIGPGEVPAPLREAAERTLALARA
ncbi:MAG: AAA family ATPase [Acidobacteriota bacterium]|nr:AAA family ATPase [Acidobacteriota bacterium]